MAIRFPNAEYSSCCLRKSEKPRYLARPHQILRSKFASYMDKNSYLESCCGAKARAKPPRTWHRAPAPTSQGSGRTSFSPPLQNPGITSQMPRATETLPPNSHSRRDLATGNSNADTTRRYLLHRFRRVLPQRRHNVFRASSSSRQLPDWRKKNILSTTPLLKWLPTRPRSLKWGKNSDATLFSKWSRD